MTDISIIIRPESAEFDTAIEELNAEAFGPGRYARAAYRLRERARHCEKLSFVALIGRNAGTDAELAGSVRLTRIDIGDDPALLLGPLVVSRSLKNLGIGRELMNRAMEAARADGHKLVILVGDLPYYRKFGFLRLQPGQVRLPGPVDPARLLGCELRKGSLVAANGLAGPQKARSPNV